MRIVFMGTPEFAVPVLTEIVGQGHQVAAVYTRAPKPGGRRGLEPTLSPVHAAALRFGLPVLTPSSLRTEDAAATLTALEPDAIVVVAYGLILPKAILEIAPRACLNLHASLLPRWRGAAPIQRAIMAGDDETGVMVMAMEEGLDTGPVAMVERIEIGPEATADEIHDRLSLIGADLMVRALAAQNRGSLHFTPQAEEGVTYAKKIEKTEARIDWERPAAEVHNLIRALAPFPGAFFEADLGKGSERIKILRAHLVDGSGEPGEALDDALTIACGEGAIAIIELQRSGKAPMSAADFLRGARLSAGSRLAVQKSSDAAL
ncbi:10-formyltetrahydrofolate:L-methionyl-tRNA(fMet) N-formyltransferase [Methylocella tundrae]|uniref:Methionyl-tRNA formyltransferase n=2 Tax=Methylocella tundrae TaxID=227605 RepID=A0A4U8YUT8_METTU|nr:methionyl-tRNA formyltransferase [Methylocella tundrae]WPP05233.1 methionyl-tRNA formyltransferase [Methylocella tundrae]VFU07579.1 10-formyltetrahydrofolate:L-methionyl-tRNA(fMet) N-formyltransferase [Methylocella tundrae]